MWRLRVIVLWLRVLVVTFLVLATIHSYSENFLNSYSSYSNASKCSDMTTRGHQLLSKSCVSYLQDNYFFVQFILFSVSLDWQLRS